MVMKKEYKNSSNVIRDALVRLMKEEGESLGDLDVSADQIEALSEAFPTISANVMISFPINNPKLEKKLNKLEISYHSSIIHKSLIPRAKVTTIIYVLEDDMNTIQTFITELNAFEELKSFRYSIEDFEEQEPNN